MDDTRPPMSVVDTLRNHVRDHKRGMFVDLVFAIAWVTAVSVIFDLLSAPSGLTT